MDDIPEPLTRLVRLIMKGFYNVEHKIVVDMLIRRREIKEDDLMEVLKFERKHLRSLIQQLKQDRFIGIRHSVETGADGKSTRHHYYSINYRMFVNVVKYKIDHMRRKLETEERDLTSRSSFICESCEKTYTDLQADQIYDPVANKFSCSYCDGSVVEDPNVQPQADSRLVMAKYNEQMEPIYLLLQETENIKWSILEADRNNATNANSSTAANVRTEGNSTTTTTITSASGSTTEIVVDIKRLHDDDWLNNVLSTSNNNYNYSSTTSAGTSHSHVDKNSDTKHTINPDIESLLLREEDSKEGLQTTNISSAYSLSSRPQAQLSNSHDVCNGHNGNDLATNRHNDSFIDEDEDDDGPPIILVGSQRVPIKRISDEHIKMMSKQQKDEYIRLVKQIYSILYD